MNSQKATLIGFSAIILWSSLVALMKTMSESFGVIGGAALMYSLASIFLFFTLGWISPKDVSKKYLITGGSLFVLYEFCLMLSIGYSQSAQQAIEIGMINYLWPTFTIIASILFNKQPANKLVFPGFILSMIGIFWVLGDSNGINIPRLISNIQHNPFSYTLAFIGSIIWAAYCIYTARMAKGKNGVLLFFIIISISFWIIYFSTEQTPLTFNLKSTISLIIAASALGFGYAAWNIGILHGNIIALATVSYFTPIFSTLISSFVLQSTLTFSFWQGVIMVCLGSFLCFLSTKNTTYKNNSEIQSN